ncbi:MAG: NeuD/PglB/VioB family sugar acetyltransferase [Coriobacteriia bacterium]|nr:NeuD/PglB/VioB family sugar acetyltransferase [Coriobacteriia bacterium]
MRLLVVGAGGHAKVVVDAAEAAGHDVVGVIGLPSDPSHVLGHPVVDGLDGIQAEGFVIAIGDNATRARFFAQYCESGLVPAVVVHPSVIVGSDVELGAGTFAAAGVVINTGARIGADSILNTGCSVDHDCIVGAHSHLGPQVALCGTVTLGEGVLMGVGSCASPGASVGAWSVVGAGAAVVGELPSLSVCIGVPARAVRTIEEHPGV